MKELDDLFNEISKLRDQFKDKGEFNVLHSIGFRHQEVMHSKFIAILLDPKAQHGKKKQFLELFLTQIGILDFNTKNVTISTEKRAEKRSMDITVENENSIIIIENKVWAADQICQLEDYHNFCIKTWKKVEVVYLTPYGHSPSSHSLGETLSKEHVRCISYEKSIIPWIEKCVDLTEELTEGRLKHSMQMYCEVLRVLINRDKYMNKIFDYLMEDREKLKLAIDISSALKERDFIAEFPKSIDFLIQCLYDTGRNVNPYPVPFSVGSNNNRLTIADDIKELEGWDIVFEKDAVLAQKRCTDLEIYLFNPRNINDERLQSLILQQEEIAIEWINEILEEMECKA